MHRIQFLILIVLALTQVANVLPHKRVLGATTTIEQAQSYVETTPAIVTTTAFEQTEISTEETIPFETKYEKDAEMDYGEEKTTQEGIDGSKTYYYLVTHWGEEEIDRKLLKTDTVEPTPEMIAQGTKITWRMLEGTEYGRLKYWHKMKVWATKYDGNCYGCSGRTFSGTIVVKGVCATDPKVIPLGTNFYVEGYGLCRAEDIGGAIKGNKIDLGFENASKGAWGSGYTNIYLLTNAPE